MTTIGAGIGAGASASALYTVPASGNVTRGWHRNSIVVPPALDPLAFALQNWVSGGLLWDRVIIPKIESTFSAKGVRLHMPRNSFFYLNDAGVARATPAKGYHQVVRKGYDRASRTFWFWLQVL